MNEARKPADALLSLIQDENAHPFAERFSWYQPVVDENWAEFTHLWQTHFKQRYTKPQAKTVQDLLEADIASLKQAHEDFAGLACFVRHGEDAETPSLILTPCWTAPADRWRWDCRYDLVPLIRASAEHPVTLIVVAGNTTAELYWLRQSRLYRWMDVASPLYAEGRGEASEQFNPTPDGSIRHGTGAANVERHEAKVTDRLITEVAQVLDQHFQDKAGFEELVLLASEPMRRHSNSLIDRLSRYSDHPPILLETNPDHRAHLHTTTLEALAKARQTRARDQLAQWQEAPAQLAQGWADVCAAARDGRVRRLLLSPEVDRPGYALDQALPYLDAPDDSARGTDHLVSCVRQRVLNTDGEVTVWPREWFPDQADLPWAELRF